MHKEWAIIDTISGDPRYRVIRFESLSEEERENAKIVGSRDSYLESYSEAINLESKHLQKDSKMLRRNPRKNIRKNSKKWADFSNGDYIPGWKKSYSQKKRLQALRKLIKKETYADIIGKLNQLANVNQDYNTAKKARADMLKLKKEYRPEEHKKDRKEFKKTTERLLKKKKKPNPKKKKAAKKKTTKKKCPGSKIRSKGRGKGLGRGRGKGPIGRPSKKMRLTLPESSFKTMKSLEDAIYKRAKKINPDTTRDWAKKSAKKLMKSKKKK